MKKSNLITLLITTITILMLIPTTAFCEQITGESIRLYDYVNNTDKYQTYTSLYPTTDSNNALYHIGILNILRPNITSGVTQSGYEYGQYLQTFRNAVNDNTDDNGTLNSLGGMLLQYGHYNNNPSASPNTNTVWGLYLSPYFRTGNVTNWYDIYIGAGSDGGNITNRYAIYQAASEAKSYFAGNVGIGTTNPSTNLQIGTSLSNKIGDEIVRISKPSGGAGTVTTALHIDSHPSDINYTEGIAIEMGLKHTTYNEYTSRIVHYGYAAGTRASKLQLQTHSVQDGVWNTGLLIDDVGNVGIGTTNPGSYKLAVNGTIRAKEVKVETGWSDFVFEENYTLPTLNQVESYIKENKHLPDIPSAKQVEEEGLSMAEMMTKQMQKIEELTLYLIEMKKENETLKERITALENNN